MDEAKKEKSKALVESILKNFRNTPPDVTPEILEVDPMGNIYGNGFKITPNPAHTKKGEDLEIRRDFAESDLRLFIGKLTEKYKDAPPTSSDSKENLVVLGGRLVQIGRDENENLSGLLEEAKKYNEALLKHQNPGAAPLPNMQKPKTGEEKSPE